MTKFQQVLEKVKSTTFSADPSGFVETEYYTDEEVLKMLRKKDAQWLRDHTTRIEPIVPHVKVGRDTIYPKTMFLQWMNSRIETRPTSRRK